MLSGHFSTTKPFVMTSKILSSSIVEGIHVKNDQGENLGKIKDLMIDVQKGEVAYAVLSFGGIMGVGEKYFAVPFEAFYLDPDDEKLVLKVAKEKLERAKGFDKNNWPTHANNDHLRLVYDNYNYEPKLSQNH